MAGTCIDTSGMCFRRSPSGAGHNEMLLGPADKGAKPISEEGMVLV